MFKLSSGLTLVLENNNYSLLDAERTLWRRQKFNNLLDPQIYLYIPSHILWCIINVPCFVMMNYMKPVVI